MLDEYGAPCVPLPEYGVRQALLSETNELGHHQTCPKCGLTIKIGWKGAAVTGGRFQLQAWFVRAVQRPEFRHSGPPVRDLSAPRADLSAVGTPELSALE